MCAEAANRQVGRASNGEVQPEDEHTAEMIALGERTKHGAEKANGGACGWLPSVVSASSFCWCRLCSVRLLSNRAYL